MGKYHVLVDKDGIINAACFTKNGNWTNKTDVTTEALEAVRDHLIIISTKEKKNIAFRWEYPDGRVIVLRLDETTKDKIGEPEQ